MTEEVEVPDDGKEPAIVEPEEEPETKALTTLCRNIDFERAIALHSQGREIYCSFGRHTPVLSFRLASIFSQASGYNIAFPEEIAKSHFYGEGRSAEFFDEPILKAAACGNLLGKGYVVAACL